MAADLAAFDRDTSAATGTARDFCWEHGNISWGLTRCNRLAPRREVFVSPIPVDGRGETLVQRYFRLVAELSKLGDIRTTAVSASSRRRRCDQLDLAAA